LHCSTGECVAVSRRRQAVCQLISELESSIVCADVRILATPRFFLFFPILN
jgi:hypothetical protein